jgi:hypothetical protein
MHSPRPNPTQHATPVFRLGFSRLGFSRRGAALPRPMSATPQRLASIWVPHTLPLRVGLGLFVSRVSQQTKKPVTPSAARDLLSSPPACPTLNPRSVASRGHSFPAKLNFPHPTHVSINGIMETMPTHQTVTPPRTSNSLRHLVSHHTSPRSAAPSGPHLGFQWSGRTLDRPASRQALVLVSQLHKKEPVIPNGVREVRNPSWIPAAPPAFSLFGNLKLKT